MAEKAMSANCIPIGLVVGNTHLVMSRWASENNRAVAQYSGALANALCGSVSRNTCYTKPGYCTRIKIPMLESQRKYDCHEAEFRDKQEVDIMLLHESPDYSYAGSYIHNNHVPHVPLDHVNNVM